MSENSKIENVSDTALWVAMYRAMETDRPDAHFKDPYARALAGERGAAILAAMPDGEATAWPLIVRTAVFDEMILKAVRERGAKIVLNLASGLDMRPYRLNLPSDLEWIEVDLPDMMDYKTSRIGDAKPTCRLERVKLDLADIPARRAFFDRVDSSGKPTLVMSEGLLTYLTDEAVASLAHHQVPDRLVQQEKLEEVFAKVASPEQKTRLHDLALCENDPLFPPPPTIRTKENGTDQPPHALKVKAEVPL